MRFIQLVVMVFLVSGANAGEKNPVVTGNEPVNHAVVLGGPIRTPSIQSEGVKIYHSYYDFQTNGGQINQCWVDPNSNGSLVHAIWMGDSSSSTFTNRRDYYSKSTNGGKTWSTPTGVESERCGYGNIAAFSDGRMVVASHTGTLGHVWIEDSKGSGKFTLKRAFNTDNTNNPIWPYLAVTPDSAMCVIGTSNTTPNYTWSSRLDNPSTTKFRTNRPWWRATLTHGVACSPKGQVVYASAYPWASSANIYLYFSSDSGKTMTDSLQLTNYNVSSGPYAHRNLDVEFFGEKLLLVWEESTGGSDISSEDVNNRLRFYSPKVNNGKPVTICSWDSTWANDSCGYSQTAMTSPTIGADDDGNLYVVFTGYKNNTSYSGVSFLPGDIYVCYSLDGGERWSKPMNLTNTPKLDDRYASISPWNESGFLNFTWQEDITPGNHVANDFTTPVPTLTNRRFLKTSVIPNSYLKGKVVDARDSKPIAGAIVRLDDNEFGTMTDSAGNYNLRLPQGIYKLVATASGFSDASTDTMSLQDKETKTVNLAMKFPVFEFTKADTAALADVKMPADTSALAYFHVKNAAAVSWGADLRFAPTFELELNMNSTTTKTPVINGKKRHLKTSTIGDTIRSWEMGDTIYSPYGVAWVDHQFWVTASMDTGSVPKTSHWFFVYDSAGNFVKRIPQWISAVAGFKGLAANGIKLYTSIGKSELTEINKLTGKETGRTISISNSGITQADAITFDQNPNTNMVFFAKDQSPVFYKDLTSSTSKSRDLAGTGKDSIASVSGVAYDALTKGGPYLWISSREASKNGAKVRIYQYHLATKQLTGEVIHGVGSAAEESQGLDFSLQPVPGRAALIQMQYAASDVGRLVFYDAGVPFDGIKFIDSTSQIPISPSSRALLTPGKSMTVQVEVSSRDLLEPGQTDTVIKGFVLVDHNGSGPVQDSPWRMPFKLSIHKPFPSGPFALVAPDDNFRMLWDTTQSPALGFVWTTSKNATKYRWEMADDENFTTNLVQVNDLTDTVYQVTSISLTDTAMTYYWRVTAFNTNEEGDSLASSARNFRLVQPKGLSERQVGLPTVFALHQNFPNPFNPVTNIRFDLPVSGKVRMTVYDLQGRKVTDLLDANLQAGYKSLQWNGQNKAGQAIASGVYFLVMKVNDGDKLLYQNGQKLTMIK